MRGIIEATPDQGYVQAFDEPDQLISATEALLNGPPELWAVTVDGYDATYLYDNITSPEITGPNRRVVDSVVPDLAELGTITQEWCRQNVPRRPPASLELYLKSGDILPHFDEDDKSTEELRGPITASLRIDPLGDDERNYKHFVNTRIAKT